MVEAREIKFRARLSEEYKGTASAWQYFTLEEAWGCDVNQDVLDWSTVCQFTGLLDKNGKEIYEGDIVKIYYYSRTVGRPTDITTRLDVIIYDGTGFKLKSARYRETWGEFEVVGNTVENNA